MTGQTYLMSVGVDPLCVRERDHDPDNCPGELDRGQDGGDDQLRPRRDVGRPPGRLRGRVKDPRDSVGLRQEGAVHEAGVMKALVKNGLRWNFHQQGDQCSMLNGFCRKSDSKARNLSVF